MAEGVYTPDEDGDGGRADNDEEGSFTLSHNTVQLYGGFTGDETARKQRDWEANVTVLSGDIDGVVVTTTHINGSNANHVLWLRGDTYEPITGDTVIDRFTITAGQADGDGIHTDGGGLYCAGNGGGAGCSPTVRTIIFSGNSAQGDGGAMHNTRSICPWYSGTARRRW